MSEKGSISSKSDTNFSLLASNGKADGLLMSSYKDHSIDQTQVQEEEHYKRLTNLYQNLMASAADDRNPVGKLLEEIREYTSSELLGHSQNPLWKQDKKLESRLSAYCMIITCMNDGGTEISILEKQGCSFLVAQKTNQPNSMLIMEAEHMALQFSNRRQALLEELGKRCSQSRMSELSRQIVVLYHEYNRLRKKVENHIKVWQAKEKDNKINEEAEQILKKLTRELKLMKRSQMKK